jgi:hypothetical protein
MHAAIDGRDDNVIQRVLAFLRGDDPPQTEPACPNHGVQMELFKKVGKPARYNDQETETYDFLYRCPVPGCDESATRRRIRNQIPVPGETTARPAWTHRQKSL